MKSGSVCKIVSELTTKWDRIGRVEETMIAAVLWSSELLWWGVLDNIDGAAGCPFAPFTRIRLHIRELDFGEEWELLSKLKQLRRGLPNLAEERFGLGGGMLIGTLGMPAIRAPPRIMSRVRRVRHRPPPPAPLMTGRRRSRSW